MALASLPEVQAVEEVRVFQGDRIEGGALIKATQLRNELGGTGRGVGVAVIDSGIYASHPDFGSRVVAHLDATRTTGDGRIDQAGHGTAVAGIAAGAGGGMAPEANLWAMKALNSAGQGTSDWILTALNAVYAARDDHGGIRVVNMSLSDATLNATDCDVLSPAFSQAIDRLTAAGIAVFTSSGNSGYATGISHPACLSNAISVGALYDADSGPALFSVCRDASTAADQIICYSNSGPPLDLLAPSHCARTTKAGGGYLNCFGGTSASSPYVAGVAAQILSLRPDTTPAALREALMSTGRPVGEPWTGLVRHRIDAVAAYHRLTGGATPDLCVPSATTLCLAGGRFKVEAAYEAASGAAGQAHLVQLTDDSGYLWFFNSKNVEAVVKVLDACSLGGKYWVFAGGLTDVRTTLNVTDTRTGTVKTYTNPQGAAFLPIQDTAAFATCP
ncbi:MAG TPA: S8 family serine peptidase [Thermoanaerobaculia bacterium]|nr:S8 family serine peptidase [Thermoanaerobaculia bacterium]